MFFSWEAFQEEEEAPAAEAEEIPDWLQAAQPTEESAPAEPETVAEEVAPTEEEEIPDWLRELQPPAETAAEEATITEPVAEETAEPAKVREKTEEEERQARIDKIMGRRRPTKAAAAPPKEETPSTGEEKEMFGWSSFEEKEKVTEEPEPEMEEPIPSFGFTSFEEDIEAGEEEEITAEKPEPKQEVQQPPAEPTPEPAAAVVEPPAPDFDLEQRKSYLTENKKDHPARLELAEALWAKAERKEALEQYDYLIQHAGELMEQVIADLQGYTQEEPAESQALQLLGDAYMKEGATDKALDAYRKAMAGL